MAIPGSAFAQISGEYELQSSVNSTLSLKLDMKVCTFITEAKIFRKCLNLGSELTFRNPNN